MVRIIWISTGEVQEMTVGAYVALDTHTLASTLSELFWA